MPTDILIVDDEDDIRELVSGILSDEGHGTRLARNSDEALAGIEARRPHLVLLDIWLQGSRLDGLQLLEILKKQHANVPVVMISGHGNIETAVTAIKLGAYGTGETTARSSSETPGCRSRATRRSTERCPARRPQVRQRRPPSSPLGLGRDSAAASVQCPRRAALPPLHAT